VESPCSGTVLRIMVAEGSELPVQTPLALVGQAGEDVSRPTVHGKSVQAQQAAAGAQEKAVGNRTITPRARKLIKENAIPLELFDGIEMKRITESEVLKVMRGRQAERSQRRHPGDWIDLSPRQRIMSEKMTESSRDIPQFSMRFRVEMDYALSLLDSFSARFGTRITLNSLLLRAAAIALSHRPVVLRQYREGRLFQPAEVNIGIAVATEGEITVPVIRHADRKSIEEIAAEASRVIEKARTGKLQPDDVSGGTITVTNLGMLGVSSFVPLVNPGESAILGVGALQESCRERDGSFETYRILEFTLVCDHRSVNGVVSAEFCRELTKTMESARETAW